MAEQNQRAFAQADAAELLSGIIRGRHRRSTFFSAELFADPAWDILLDLFLAELQQRTVAVRELGRSSTVPSTILNRWLDKLEKDGWLGRKPDPSNPDRRVAALSAAGRSAMQAWLGEWIESRATPGGNRVSELLERIALGRREA